MSVWVKRTPRPRYFTDEVGFIFSPLTLKLSCLFICWNLFLKIIIFVLPLFSDNVLLRVHWQRCFKSPKINFSNHQNQYNSLPKKRKYNNRYYSASMNLINLLKANWKHIRGNAFMGTHLEIHLQKHIRISNFISQNSNEKALKFYSPKGHRKM